jgi:hypothetical protein
MHVKFQSFNYFGRGLQDLSGVTDYTLTLTPLSSLPATPTGLGLAGGGSTWIGPHLDLICNPAERATSYRFDVYKSDGTTLLRQLTSSTPSTSYTSSMASIDGAERSYKIAVTALNDAGASSTTSQISVSNSAPAAVTSPSASGGTTTGVVTCTASGDPDVVGYIVFYSSTSGFDPLTAGGVALSGIPSISIYGVAAGTYYARIAAYDPWTARPDLLNLSAEQSFVISVGGGSTPTGGGDAGGGYEGKCADIDRTLVLLANDSRDGPGEIRMLRDCRPGVDHVWTRHEATGEFGAFLIETLSFHDALVYRADPYPPTTPKHRFATPETSQAGVRPAFFRMEEIGKPERMAVVGKMTVRDAHTYMTALVTDAEPVWFLSHNAKQEIE